MNQRIEQGVDIIITAGLIATNLYNWGMLSHRDEQLFSSGIDTTPPPLATETPIPNAVELYNNAVKTDVKNQRDAFSTAGSGSTDLSGQGYQECVFNSDCLAGVQICVAGPIPNTQSEPGYCVPVTSTPQE